MGKQSFRVNEMIRISPVRLIDDSNNQVGVLDTSQAISMAREAGKDLVEVSPTSSPPVCRIMDFGKWLYQQKRKEKLNQKKQHTVVIKEIRLRPKIDDHDRDIKVDQAAKFLEKGYKVQFTVLFRGREMAHMEQAFELMEGVLTTLGNLAKIERPATKLGKRMIMIVTPQSH